jgi:antitoxin (DNA-binding transcriptional repressor) of toxin-antitoxin stability system
MKRSRTPETLGAEEARQCLPAILSAAASGRTTIITRHGKAVAAVVPIGQTTAPKVSVSSLAGSGRGLWGADSRRRVRAMRDEWNG